ncbi:MAG TPA: NADH-quinone oxidoreductase subunit J [Thermoflexia bacterium]|nr:NADH-quinone oxidoreductase subunit J [Thermoflexia bacterium]
MTLQQVLFIIFGAITLGAALMVVTRRNVFHAALFLILSFFGIAGLYVLLEAPFLAATQMFIYVGGIAILILFALMLTQDMMNPNLTGANRQWGLAALVAVALCAVLGWTVLNHNWAVTPGDVPAESIVNLGKALVDPAGLVLPFEVASVMLLVALIGAVTIARER